LSRKSRNYSVSTTLAVQIGQIIRQKRTESNITQESLALKCEIDRSYLGRIERGEVNLTVDKLYQIAQVLQISPKDLLPD
jgi:transcriptional regulator with XRE-family HTH domain